MCRKLPPFHSLPLQKNSATLYLHFSVLSCQARASSWALYILQHQWDSATPDLLPVPLLVASDSACPAATLPKFVSLPSLHTHLPSICRVYVCRYCTVTALNMFYVFTQFISSSVPRKKYISSQFNIGKITPFLSVLRLRFWCWYLSC